METPATNADRIVAGLNALTASGHKVTAGVVQELHKMYPDDTIVMKPILDTGAVAILQGGKIVGTTAATKGGGEARLQEYQAKAQTFVTEMQQAQQTIDQVEKEGYNPTANAWDRLTPDIMNTPKGRIYADATKKWCESILRDRSGAAINAGEYKAAMAQFFPKWNENAEAIAIKRDRREKATAAMQANILGARVPVYSSHGVADDVYDEKKAPFKPTAPAAAGGAALHWDVATGKFVN